MSKLNWEKQNKLEQPKERRRRLDREKVTKAYANGAKNERERIIKLLESTLGIGLDLETTDFRDTVIKNAVKLIKGEQK